MTITRNQSQRGDDVNKWGPFSFHESSMKFYLACSAQVLKLYEKMVEVISKATRAFDCVCPNTHYFHTPFFPRLSIRRSFKLLQNNTHHWISHTNTVFLPGDLIHCLGQSHLCVVIINHLTVRGRFNGKKNTQANKQTDNRGNQQIGSSRYPITVQTEALCKRIPQKLNVC